MEYVSAAEEAEETRVELVKRRKASDAEPKVAVSVSELSGLRGDVRRSGCADCGEQGGGVWCARK